MYNIDKTIELIKVEYEKLGDCFVGGDWERYVKLVTDSIMPIITAYRQLEKELEKVDDLCEGADDYFEMKAELSKAQAANAELLAALKQYNETIENYVTMENQIPFDDPTYKDDVEIINKVRQITKHKGE